MPIYEYQCLSCGEHLDFLQRGKEEPPESCPSCGGKLAKVLSKPGGFVFKGSGFYATDYAQRDAACCGQTEPCENPKRCCEKK